tara:strand:+ start:186 stop:686 length:501 start_codon:yes stop_codon:yes gene_type:complete
MNYCASNHQKTLVLSHSEIIMSMRYNLIKCSCGFTFGSTKSKNNYCTKCGSTSNLKYLESFDNAEKLARAISFANIPDEISDELISKIKKKETKIKTSRTNNGNILGGLSILKKATDEEGNLTKSSLDKFLSEEGMVESSSEYLIGQAEVQGFLIRINENTWNWLS